jgi:hypothetical protein
LHATGPLSLGARMSVIDSSVIENALIGIEPQPDERS